MFSLRIQAGYRKIISVLVMFMLLHSIPAMVLAADGGTDELVAMPEDGVAAESSPIEINGESELATTASTNGWMGNGSSDNPYIIRDIVFNGTGSPWCLRLVGISTSHVIVRDNRFHNATGDSGGMLTNASLSLADCINVTVENNIIEDNPNIGISVSDSTVLISNNTIRNNQHGLYIDSDDTCIIEGNTLFRNIKGVSAWGPQIVKGNSITGVLASVGFGMKYMRWAPKIVSDNIVTNVAQGLFVHANSNVATYYRNSFSNCTYAIWSEREQITFDNNSIEASNYGFYLKKGYNTLKGNHMTGTGIWFDFSALDKIVYSSQTIDASNTVEGAPVHYLVNTAGTDLDPSSYGQVIVADCSRVRMSNSSVRNGFIFTVGFSDNISLVDSVWRSATNGFWMSLQTEDLLIENNTIEGFNFNFRVNYYGSISNNSFEDSDVEFHFVYYVQFSNNTLWTYMKDPLTLANSVSLKVYDNNITVKRPAPGIWSIALYSSSTIEFHNNSLWGAGILGPYRTNKYWGGHKLDSSNTVNGRPFLYLVYARDMVVSGEYGQVIATNCFNITFSSMSIGESHGGFGIADSELVTIERCSFNDLVNPALSITRSKGIFINKNLFRGGNSRIDLYEITKAYSDPFDTISENYFINLTPDSQPPAAISTYRAFINNMEGNYFSGINGHAVGDSVDIIISAAKNEFRNCTSQAIKGLLWWSKIHHNAFFDNGVGPNGSQCLDSSPESDWDNGTEGNYWSDYNMRYPISSNDGTVWNTPYSIDGIGKRLDRYPLVQYVDRVAPLVFASFNDSIYPDIAVEFTAEAIDNVGVVEYNWSFYRRGNITFRSGKTFDHVFNESGEYIITITVRDAAGNEDSAPFPVRVIDNIPPIALAGDDQTIVPGTLVTLDAGGSNDDHGIVDYTWSFEYNGEDVVLNGDVVQFKFDNQGTYNVTLTVSDAAGNTAFDSLVLNVGDFEPPIASIGDDRTVPQRATLMFSGLASTDNWRIDSYNWTVTSPGGKVTQYDTPEFSHIFLEVGIHTVTLRVTDPAGLSGESVVSVTVLDVTSPVAVTPGDTSVGQHMPLRLDGTASTDNEAVVNWTWAIEGPSGDVTLFGADVEHSFGEAGVHTVTLTVTDDAGNEDFTTFSVTVLDRVDPVAVAGEDITVDEGDRVTLDGSASTDNVGIVSYSWSFVYEGEEVEFQSPTPDFAFTFDVPGVYTVTLTAVDGENYAATDQVTVTVRDITPPVADAGKDVDGDQHTQVTFDGSGSYDNVEGWLLLWTFEYGGEEQFLLGLDPQFTFDLAGEYVVTLTVRDDVGNEASDTIAVTVLDTEPPTADAADTVYGKTGIDIPLNGSGSTDNVGIVSWTWSFEYGGTVRTLEGETATFVFEEPGDYDLTLTVTDAMGLEGVDTITVKVEAEGPDPDPPPDDDDEGLSMAVIGGIAAAIVIAALVAIVLMRGRSETD